MACPKEQYLYNEQGISPDDNECKTTDELKVLATRFDTLEYRDENGKLRKGRALYKRGSGGRNGRSGKAASLIMSYANPTLDKDYENYKNQCAKADSLIASRCPPQRKATYNEVLKNMTACFGERDRFRGKIYKPHIVKPEGNYSGHEEYKTIMTKSFEQQGCNKIKWDEVVKKAVNEVKDKETKLTAHDIAMAKKWFREGQYARLRGRYADGIKRKKSITKRKKSITKRKKSITKRKPKPKRTLKKNKKHKGTNKR